MFRALTLLLLCACAVSAQGRVPKEFLDERIMVVVPMIGQGTAEDPMRPMFMPKPADIAKSPFLSIQVELSDDGKTALVEFVARSKDAFKEILAARGKDVKVFERGKNKKEDVEQEFGKVKSGYKFHEPGKEAK